jgi:hypothetical protein
MVFAALLAVYLSNGRLIGSPDTLPARYLPLSILRSGTFYLDTFLFLYDKGASTERREGLPYYVVQARGHYVSWYPVGAALLALPLYLPAVLWGVDADSPVLAWLEKLSASTIVALSAAILYLALRHVATRGISLLIVGVYALGTSSLSVSSQALWQHGPSQLALVVALYALLRGRIDAHWVIVAGFPLAFAVIARPSDALLAAPLLAYVWRYHPDQQLWFVASGLPPLLFQVWYNLIYFGDPLHTQLPPFDPSLWGTTFGEGLAGLLLSPGRGLLVYSPVFLLCGVGMARAWRRGGDPLVRALSVGAVLVILLYSKWAKWWGGWTYGPRLLADLSPVLALGLVPLGERLGRRGGWRIGFVTLALWSIGAHAMGAYVDDLSWNRRVDVEHHPERLWLWTDNQLVDAVRWTISGVLTQ